MRHKDLASGFSPLASATKSSQSKSEAWFERAQKAIPGGVNSPVRAFGAVGGTPPFLESGSGSRVFDADGNSYLDFVGSWGALILGHAHPRVVSAAKKAVERGSSFGAATSEEVLLAEVIQTAIPSIEKLRLVNSGTEAAMTAIRLARAFTKRDKMLKFEGCYHGHADPFLVKAGSGLLTFGNPSSQGIPEEVLKNTLVATYNSLESLESAFAKYGDELACAIVEPVAGNMGVVLPRPGFLEKLAVLCRRHETLLIFDEVITGFRFHFGGVQDLHKIRPDLTCLGKIIGGGFPLAAVGGREDVLSQLAPLGPVYQAGTLSGNPVATSAGLAALKILREENRYAELDSRTSLLADKIRQSAAQIGLKIVVNQIGSMFSIFFNPGPVEAFEQVMASDREPFKILFHHLMESGVYPPPSPFEAWFVSTAHTDVDISSAVERLEQAFLSLRTV